MSKGRENADIFFGLVLRGGASVIGSNLIIGAGLTLSNVATGLSKGEVGKPLPAEVSSLDDIVKRSLRPGAAVVFSLSGLSLGGKSATEAVGIAKYDHPITKAATFPERPPRY